MSTQVPAWTAGARVIIKGRIHGQETVNVLHFATANTLDVDTELGEALLQLANDVMSCLVQTLLPGVTSDWQLHSVEALRFWPSVGDQFIVVPQSAAVGAKSAASNSFAATLVNISTGGGGKSGRGRIFLPPPGETEVAASTIDGPTVALIVAFCTCMVGKFMGQNPTSMWRLGVFSRTKFAGLTGSFQAAFRAATSLVPSPTCAVMRSRRIGHGS